jgi:signal transduction histidine kinase
MDSERFLSNTISILAASSDLRTTVDSLVRLAVRDLADCCGVFMIENEQTIRRLSIASRSCSELGSDELDSLYPLNLHAVCGPGHVLRTGEAQLLTAITPEVIESFGLKTGELVLASGAMPSICLCVPGVARGRVIGAIALLAGETKRTFDDRDRFLALALADAAAVAIDNARLYREAQEANRLKDEFVAMVSHELRTPLTPLLGCIHLLKTADMTQANFNRVLEMIERHAHTQVQIVEDLFDASRIVAGKLHLVMKSTSIEPVVESAIESVRASADAKQIRIVTSFEDIPHPIDGDPHRLQQIVWNLLSNAVKFTPARGTIEISLRDEKDYVQIQVTDTGIGIPADVLPGIFDRFRQPIDGNSKMRSGLRLGLAIVRHLVELHNGSIQAESAGPGQGAVFTLRFPFAARKAAAATS